MKKNTAEIPHANRKLMTTNMASKKSKKTSKKTEGQGNFTWTDDEIELLLAVIYEYKNSKELFIYYPFFSIFRAGKIGLLLNNSKSLFRFSLKTAIVCCISAILIKIAAHKHAISIKFIVFTFYTVTVVKF